MANIEKNVQPYLDSEIQSLLEEEEGFSSSLKDFEYAHSGLKDIDATLRLASLKLRIANELLALIKSDRKKLDDYAQTIRKKANEAANLLEELFRLPGNDDDKEQIRASEEYKRLQKQIASFLVDGGGIYFERRLESHKNTKLVSRTIERAIRRWISPDDEYHAAFDFGKLPPFLGRLLRFFFPFIWQDKEENPVCGSEEGEEEITAERLKLPLSQAMYYLENELLPGLKSELEDSPGDPILQAQIAEIEDQTATLRKMKYFPRSTPVFPETGYYTDSMSSFTPEGELVINVKIPVSYKSVTKLDRFREAVKGEISRRLCGKGISKELDEEYSYLKSIDSGLKGSSRTPSLKVDIEKAFGLLKLSIPALKMIEDRSSFRRLVSIVMTHGEADSRKMIEAFIKENVTAQSIALP